MRDFLFVSTTPAKLLPPIGELIKVLKSEGVDQHLAEIHMGSTCVHIHYPGNKTKIEVPLRTKLSKIIVHKRIKSSLCNTGLVQSNRIIVLCDIVSLQSLSKLVTNSYLIYWAFELKGMIGGRIKLNVDLIRKFQFRQYLKKIAMVLSPSEGRQIIIQKFYKHGTIKIVGNYRAYNQLFSGPQIPQGKTKLYFGGRVSETSGILSIIQHVQISENLELHICGILDTNLELSFENLPKNVRYHGYLNKYEMIALAMSCDISVVTYDSRYHSTLEYACPTKLGDALAFGHMIIGSKQPYIEKIVNSNNLGFVTTIPQITNAIDCCNGLSAMEIFEYKQRSYDCYLDKYNMNCTYSKLKDLFHDCNR